MTAHQEIKGAGQLGWKLVGQSGAAARIDWRESAYGILTAKVGMAKGIVVDILKTLSIIA